MHDTLFIVINLEACDSFFVTVFSERRFCAYKIVFRNKYFCKIPKGYHNERNIQNVLTLGRKT